MSTETKETTETTSNNETTTETTNQSENQSEQTSETSENTQTQSQSETNNSGDISGGGESEEDNKESANSGDISGVENEEKGEDDGENEESSENEFIGVPDDGYEAFTLPDNIPVDETKQESFMELAKEIGLSQAGAQKLVDWQAADLQNAVDNHMKTLDSYTEAAQADPEIGGDKFDETIKLGSEAVNVYGSPEFKKLLSETGMGKHPEMLRTFRKIGEDMQEAQSRSGSEVVSDTKPTRAQTLYGN